MSRKTFKSIKYNKTVVSQTQNLKNPIKTTKNTNKTPQNTTQKNAWLVF
jgi:hypothetical protein